MRKSTRETWSPGARPPRSQVREAPAEPAGADEQARELREAMAARDARLRANAFWPGARRPRDGTLVPIVQTVAAPEP